MPTKQGAVKNPNPGRTAYFSSATQLTYKTAALQSAWTVMGTRQVPADQIDLACGLKLRTTYLHLGAFLKLDQLSYAPP